MHRRVWALLLLLGLALPAAARAGAAETDVGIALTGTHGTHRESSGTAQAPIIPAPILAASHRWARWEVLAEGLPPVGPIGVANNGLGMRNIALTYANAGARYWNAAGTFAFGLGETLYNQHTGVAVLQSPSYQINDVQYSRVVGVRYEIVARVRRPGGGYWEAMFATDPAMHGRYTYTRTGTPRGGGRGIQFTAGPYWERASQVEGGVRFVQPFGAFALSYGVRYLNYTAAFTGRFSSPFADANSLLMPFVGIQRTFSR